MSTREQDMLATLPLPREGFAQGTVEHCNRQHCRVHVDDDDGGGRIDATVTLPGYTPVAGDRVLLARRDAGCGWIVGVLPVNSDDDGAAQEDDNTPVSIRTTGGYSAAVARDAGAERLEVRDGQGRLLYQLEPVTGRATIYAPGGDLTLASATGNVDLVAARNVRCIGRENVVLRAGGNTTDAASSSLHLARDEAALSGARIRVTGDDAQFHVRRTRIVGERVDAAVATVRTVIDRAEQKIGRLVERIRTAHRTVTGLSQLKAGRMRTRVTGANEVRSGYASITCEDELKLDGKRIHLG